MNAAEFAHKWMKNTRGERSASQEQFLDLCTLLAQPTPNSDPDGEEYAFEKGATKAGGEDGWADVWRRHCFAWEYKGKHKDLKAAYAQLLQYREALENPPLLVVCDLNRFEIHTNYTDTAKVVHEFSLQDFIDAPQRPLRLLRSVMEAPDDLKPKASREELTEKAAGHFAQLALDLRARGHEAHRVAHFINKLVFSMFAEDIGLLPSGLIVRLTSMGGGLVPDSVAVRRGMQELFQTMSEGGGYFGADKVQWFNGGLFDGDDAIELTVEELESIKSAAKLDWSQIEPAVLGTLFERGLDPDKRSQLGAHYTDRRSIERVVFPVVIEPLEREFDHVKKAATEAIGDVPLKGFVMGAAKTARTNAIKKASAHITTFLERLDSIRVLDPACGSGNFLYVALQALKDLERKVLLWEVTELGTAAMRFPTLGPHNVLGIELNLYAAELARVAIWIGEIQWMIGNGFAYLHDPVLRPLHNIECRDAVLVPGDARPTEPEWPDADFIIGNPPFVGGKLMRANLGDDYVDQLFAVYDSRVPREADFVTYWHEKARAMIAAGKVKRVGLLATQGIRGGANRKVLERIKETGDIFFAWSDEPWVVEGAAVHVSIVGYDDGTDAERTLDGHRVTTINSDLTGGIDLTRARRLDENLGIAFMGDTKGGPFDITAAVARAMLEEANPHGKANRDVIRPWVNGSDITGRPRNMYIIDFGTDMAVEQAALYEAPFEYVRQFVEPTRLGNKRSAYAERWWLHAEPRSGMRAAFRGLSRYVATPRVSKHRLFVWLEPRVLADSATITFAREDDYFFGVLQSHVHEVWARGLGTQVRERQSGFRYTPSSTFETFPLPRPTDAQRQTVATVAKQLDTWRNGWLNPGIVPDLKQRTLTNLYNSAPTWLRDAHEQLDRAVYAAYGWDHPLDNDEILARLLELNLSRSTQENAPGELLVADADDEPPHGNDYR